MLLDRLALRGSTAIVQAVGRASDVETALDAVLSEIAVALDTRACLFERLEGGWRLVGQARGGLRLSVGDLQQVLAAISSDAPIAALDLRPSGESVWTSIFVPVASGPSIAILIAGDWTVVDRMLTGLVAMLSLALAAVHDRQARRAADALLVDSYALSRRLGRSNGLEVVCRVVVDRVGRSLGAGRVALALYRPDEDRLAVAATYGYPTAVVQGERIEPGSWVIGHVYSSGRPVLVADTRRLTIDPRPRSVRYRTSSFAAVPIAMGMQTLGVLSATDKHDHHAFTRRDLATLSAFAASASLAMAAARSTGEVERLSHAAATDALTGLFNRRYLDARLHEEVERAKRTATSVAVAMADVDDFKRINDSHGHLTGDAVLRAVASVLRSAVRIFDVSARYGGDEFAIVMPNSDPASAAACGERIRHLIAARPVAGDQADVAVTMSVGVAVHEPGDTPGQLINRADRSLYRAKADGKNCVRVESGGENGRGNGRSRID